LTTDDVIEALGGWEGYSIESIDADREEGNAFVRIDWYHCPEWPGVAADVAEWSARFTM
jgi:hypothetical protein